MVISQTKIIALMSLLVGLVVVYMRTEIGYFSPDELYFTDIENIDESYFRYLVPIFVFSTLGVFGFLGVFLFHWVLLYLQCRRENKLYLIFVLLSPIVMFYTASFLRDLAVCMIIVAILFSDLRFRTRFLLFIALIVLRPEHFAITLIAYIFGSNNLKPAYTFIPTLFILICSLAFLVSYQPEIYKQMLITGGQIADLSGAKYGVLQDVYIDKVGVSDIVLNFIIALLSIPVGVDGFNLLAMYHAMLVKIICLLSILILFFIKMSFNVEIFRGGYFILFSLPIAVFVSHELSLMRWFLPVYFVLSFIGSSAIISILNSRKRNICHEGF